MCFFTFSRSSLAFLAWGSFLFTFTSPTLCLLLPLCFLPVGFFSFIAFMTGSGIQTATVFRTFPKVPLLSLSEVPLLSLSEVPLLSLSEEKRRENRREEKT